MADRRTWERRARTTQKERSSDAEEDARGAICRDRPADVVPLRPPPRPFDQFTRSDLLRYAHRYEELQPDGLLPESDDDWHELRGLTALLALASVRALLHGEPLGVDDDPPAAS